MFKISCARKSLFLADIDDSKCHVKALECLVRLASVRRSLFVSNATRLQFLSSLMMGTKDILETGKGQFDDELPLLLVFLLVSLFKLLISVLLIPLALLCKTVV